MRDVKSASRMVLSLTAKKSCSVPSSLTSMSFSGRLCWQVCCGCVIFSYFNDYKLSSQTDSWSFCRYLKLSVFYQIHFLWIWLNKTSPVPKRTEWFSCSQKATFSRNSLRINEWKCTNVLWLYFWIPWMWLSFTANVCTQGGNQLKGL